MAQKGIPFELKIKEAVEHEIQQGKLGISPELTRVYHHKAYFSRDRGKDIVTDVSVELYRKDANDPYLLWVWECKDYSHKVPVDDIEEFHAKLEQIGVHKTKGTVACRNGFQEGAIEYARSKGISLARWLPDGSIIRLLEAVRDISLKDIHKGLTESETRRLESMFYGLGATDEGTMRIGEFVASELAKNQ